MARGRKKGSAIKVLTSKDVDLLFGIARTGLTSFYDARSVIGLSEKRLKNLEKENYISSNDVVVKGKDTIKVFHLNEHGRKYIKVNSDIDKVYRSNERQIEHDLKLSSIYYSLDPEERSTWTNENDLINKYKEDNPGRELKTMIDATYTTSNGYKIAVEVVTRNYTGEQIQEKYNIADEIGCKEVLKIEA